MIQKRYGNSKSVARDPRVVSAEFDVWTKREMVFNNPPGCNQVHYPAGTKARKMPYSEIDCQFMDAMERSSEDGFPRGRSVAIELDGRMRYVWRDDVMTEAEYAEWKKDKDKLSVLRKKPKGTMD